MKITIIIVQLIVFSKILVAEDQTIDYRLYLKGWWRTFESQVITFDFIFRVEDSSAVIMNVGWYGCGPIFLNPFCRFRLKGGSNEEFVIEQKRGSNLPYRPTLFSRYWPIMDRMRTSLNIDLLKTSAFTVDKTGIQNYNLLIEFGTYSPRNGKFDKFIQSDFPEYIVSQPFTLTVDWDKETINLKNPVIIEGNHQPVPEDLIDQERIPE